MYRKEHYISATLTGLFVLAAYALTVAPTVTFWDAGEFLAAARTLGIPHPPGTPLFVNIGRVIAALPLPVALAPRLNFFSSLCGVASAVFIFLIAIRLLESLVKGGRGFAERFIVHGGAVCAAVIPAFMVTVWTNVTEFEVYAIAMATILLCAWLLVRAGTFDNPAYTRKILLLVIYLVSLSIANHLVVLLIAPAVAIYVLLLEPKRRAWWLSVLGVFLGLYLLVLKGLDLDRVGATLDTHYTGKLDLFKILWSLLAGVPDVLLHLGTHVEHAGVFLVGLLVTTGAFWWARRQGSLGFAGWAVGLFLLGFSIHLYLLIRSGFMPPINEGQPDSFAAFWAAIGREQYGSAYGILPRQAWSMITGKTAIANVADLVDNIKVYFQYNIPFYVGYFGQQYGGALLSLVYFIIGVYGAAVHFRTDRKSFWFWLTVFLVTGLVLNTYMNFKLGYSQAKELYPADGIREVRERDYFFVISFAFFGMWSGLGLAALGNRLRLSMHGKPEGTGRVAFAALAGMLFLTAFIPMAKNWREGDRSGNLVPEIYARNMMESLAPNAILFTNGDNDTFPLWFIQEVEGVRKDCRVVNLSLLNLPWYIGQMRDMSPRVPITYNDSVLSGIYAFRVNEPQRFMLDSIDITFNKGDVMKVQDLIVLDILRANRWKKPLYFTLTTPASNQTKLTPYLTIEGMAFRINPRKAADLAAADSSYGSVKEIGLVVDIPRTDSLMRKVYRYDTFFRKRNSGEGEESTQTVARIGLPLYYLSYAETYLGRLDLAVEYRLWARRFMYPAGSWDSQLDYTIGALLATAGEYKRAQTVLDSLGINPDWYTLLARIAVEQGNSEQAGSYLEHSLELDPDYRRGYANLFILNQALGRPDSAAAEVERFIRRFPADTAAVSELARFRNTGELDVARAFNIPPQK